MSTRVYAKDTNPQKWYKQIYGLLGDFDIRYRDLDTSFNLEAEVGHLDAIMMEEDETEAEKTQRLYDYYGALLSNKETWDSEAEESMASRRRGGFVQPKRSHRVGRMK
jgi:hypothetical protein